MSLTLFYITNRPDVAVIAEKYGVDRIWVDLETLGKAERQKNMDTVKSHHSVDDIKAIKPLLKKAEMLVRINSWNESSEKEIDDVINAGADVIMLPMWKSVSEVESFIAAVAGRAKITLLLETKEAVGCIDEVLKLNGIDEIHIGLNDLHISYGQSFMFELLADGTVETLCEKFKAANIPYGFGGIARLGQGMLPSENVIMEHYRLGSTRAILSRSFCDIQQCRELPEIEHRFKKHMHLLREYEKVCESADEFTLRKNAEETRKKIAEISKRMNEAADNEA